MKRDDNIRSRTGDIENFSYNQNLIAFQIQYDLIKIPPSIEEFIESPLYLGGLKDIRVYPFWKEKLKEIFPDPITSPYQFINFGGALGIGKSFNSMICALYQLVKFSFLRNPYKTLGLSANTPFTIRCFNLLKQQAINIFIDPLQNMIDGMPFFIEYRRNNGGKLPGNIKILPAKKASDMISECCLFSLISEVDFYQKEVANNIINTSISRMKGRLKRVEGFLGTIMLDSSASLKDSVVENFLKKTEFQNVTKMVKASIWEVKKDEFFIYGSFKVYAGGGEVSPHIIVPGEILTSLDRDRIIDVPMELYSEFKNDIYKSLNDFAGISLDSYSDFFTNKEALNKSFVLEPCFENVLTFDFYDNEQIYDRIGKRLLDALPKERKLYVRIDLGLKNDLCGVAIAHLDNLSYKDIEGHKVFKPKVCVPIAFALSRLQGQETSCEKIENFIIWLSCHYQLAMVSTDQYQSTPIRQTLTSNRIPTKLLSVDATDKPYVAFKNLILNEDVKLVNNELLKIELNNLQRVGDKVDHLQAYSKDVSDAVCGAIYTVLEDGIISANPSNKQSLQKFTQAINKSIMSKNGLTNFNVGSSNNQRRVRIK